MTHVWFQRDLPVLKVIVNLLDELPDAPIARSQIETASGFDAQTVRRALHSLADEPYIETIGAAEDNHLYVTRVFGEGKRAAEFWPTLTPEKLADLVREAVQEAASTEPDEHKRNKLISLGLWLAEGGRDVLSGSFSGLIVGG